VPWLPLSLPSARDVPLRLMFGPKAERQCSLWP
jgi:hypothetical protein